MFFCTLNDENKWNTILTCPAICIKMMHSAAHVGKREHAFCTLRNFVTRSLGPPSTLLGEWQVLTVYPSCQSNATWPFSLSALCGRGSKMYVVDASLAEREPTRDWIVFQTSVFKIHVFSLLSHILTTHGDQSPFNWNFQICPWVKDSSKLLKVSCDSLCSALVSLNCLRSIATRLNSLPTAV